MSNVKAYETGRIKAPASLLPAGFSIISFEITVFPKICDTRLVQNCK